MDAPFQGAISYQIFIIESERQFKSLFANASAVAIIVTETSLFVLNVSMAKLEEAEGSTFYLADTIFL